MRISYDTSKTCLHAKAWLFHRSNGHSTVYIGSSNLTYQAQVTGLEWNVRAAQRTNPALVEKFEATFDSYWANSQFEGFDAVKFASIMDRVDNTAIDITPFEIEPYPFQRQMLEQLQVERSRGRNHSLVVSAPVRARPSWPDWTIALFESRCPVLACSLSLIGGRFWNRVGQ